MGLAQIGTCSDKYIVLDVSSMEHDDLLLWKNYNKRYICSEDLNLKLLYIDFSIIISDKIGEVWMKKNRLLIDFYYSAKSIEHNHRIHDQNLIQQIVSSSPTYLSIDYDSFIIRLKNLNINYYNDKYQNFIEHSIGTVGLQFLPVVFNQKSFSVPLFRSVFTVHNLNKNSKLEFADVIIISGVDYRIFRTEVFENGKSIYAYYDFSHIPHPVAPYVYDFDNIP